MYRGDLEAINRHSPANRLHQCIYVLILRIADIHGESHRVIFHTKHACVDGESSTGS